MCTSAPEPRLVDATTGEVRQDRATGQTVWSVGLCAMRGKDSAVIQVSVVGEPKGITVGMPVRVVDLEAAPWEREGRWGIAWRVGQILPAAAPGAPAPGGSGRREGQ